MRATTVNLLRQRRELRERLRAEGDQLLIAIADIDEPDTEKVEYMQGNARDDNPCKQESINDNLQVVEDHLKQLIKRCAELRKDQYKRRNDTRVGEFHEAWKQRDLARVGRLSGLI